MLMVTNRGRNKILRDVDRTRLEVKNKNNKNEMNLVLQIPVHFPHLSPKNCFREGKVKWLNLIL